MKYTCIFGPSQATGPGIFLGLCILALGLVYRFRIRVRVSFLGSFRVRVTQVPDFFFIELTPGYFSTEFFFQALTLSLLSS